MPQDEAGLYYFYTDLYTNDPEDLYFAIRVNEQFLCRAALDIRAEGPDDNGSPSCGAVALLTEGIMCLLLKFLFLYRAIMRTTIVLSFKYFTGTVLRRV